MSRLSCYGISKDRVSKSLFVSYSNQICKKHSSPSTCSYFSRWQRKKIGFINASFAQNSFPVIIPSKTAPLVPPVLAETGNVGLLRNDKKSQLLCMKECIELIKKGSSILLFPEGTRSSNGELKNFKKGAFVIASKCHVPVVPITLVGTGTVMPTGMEGKLFPGSVDVIIHPPIYPTTANEMMDAARLAIEKPLLKPNK